MQFVVKRLHFEPQLIGQRSKFIGRHVITRAPHCTDILEAEFFRALIGDLDHAGIILAHRLADIVVPAGPHFFQLVRVTVGAHFGFDVRTVDRLPFERSLAFAISRVELGRDGAQFCGCTLCSRSGQHQPTTQNIKLALRFRRQSADILISRRLKRIFHRFFGADLTIFCGKCVGIIGNIG